MKFTDIPAPHTDDENGPAPSSFTTAQIVSLAGVILLLLLLRWNSFTMPFERDEGEYSYSAWLMRQNVMPYEHAFIQKPPMIIYTFMLAQSVSEDSLALPRILATLSVALSTLLVGFIVSREYGRAVGLSAMWIMTPMMALRGLLPFAANTELFMNFFLLSSLALYAWKRDQAKGWHWFAAGASAAIALLYKPIALPVLVFIFSAWAAEAWLHHRSLSALARPLLLAVSGGLAATLAALSPFLLHDLGATLWECSGQYNTYFARVIEPGQNPAMYFLDLFSWNVWLLAALMLWFLVKRPGRWWLYGGALLVSVASLFKASQGHYYIMTIPFIAIISSVSLNEVFRQFPRSFARSYTLKTASVTAIILLALCWPLRRQVSLSPAELCDMLYSPANPFVEAPVAAQHVAAITTPADYVFVAGSEPEILYYAKRRSPSRFITMYPLMIGTPVAEVYQEETIRALRENPPDVVVFASTRMSWLRQKGSPPMLLDFLDHYVDEQYRLVGGILFNHKEWRETIAGTEMKNCTLLVFQRLRGKRP